MFLGIAAMIWLGPALAEVAAELGLSVAAALALTLIVSFIVNVVLFFAAWFVSGENPLAPCFPKGASARQGAWLRLKPVCLPWHAFATA